MQAWINKQTLNWCDDDDDICRNNMSPYRLRITLAHHLTLTITRWTWTVVDG